MLKSENVALWCKEKEQDMNVGDIAVEKFTKNALDVYDKLTLNGVVGKFLMFERHRNGLCKLAKIS